MKLKNRQEDSESITLTVETKPSKLWGLIPSQIETFVTTKTTRQGFFYTWVYEFMHEKTSDDLNRRLNYLEINWKIEILNGNKSI